MKIGFTGTQIGMTKRQISRLICQLLKTPPDEVHIGDCIGADAQFFRIITTEFKNTITVGHPPNIARKRTFCRYERECSPLPYLIRNKAIVDDCDCLFAAPGEKDEQLRSGTWATIRYARKKHKHTTIIFPDGSLELNHNQL